MAVARDSSGEFSRPSLRAQQHREFLVFHRKQKTKPRANKKQNQKKTHHQQKNTKKTEEHPGFAFIIIYLFFLVILPVGLFFGYLLLYFFLLKSIFSVETGVLNLGFPEIFWGYPNSWLISWKIR